MIKSSFPHLSGIIVVGRHKKHRANEAFELPSQTWERGISTRVDESDGRMVHGILAIFQLFKKFIPLAEEDRDSGASYP